MPTPIGHGLAGLCIYSLFSKESSLKKAWPWMLFAAFLAMAPDLDFIGGLWIGDYNAFHRGASHSLGSCFIISTAIGLFLCLKTERPVKKLFLFLFCLYGSHLVLDYFNRDGAPPYGAQFLWPFSRAYYISPVSFFYDAHREPAKDLVSWYNAGVLLTELLWFGTPLWILNRIKEKRKTCTA